MQVTNSLMKKFIIVFSIVLIYACSKTDAADNIPDVVPDDEIITIPVVVHIVNYAPNPFDISDEKIFSQIAVLNKDFRKRNVDVTNVPDEFVHLAADTKIQFKLAVIDPLGNATTGIIRSSSEVTGWDGKTSVFDETAIENFKLYYSDKGGQDAWQKNYLNIWVADLSDRHGNLGLGGYATFPGADPRIDGVVIDPRVFGTLPPLIKNFDLGRTLTHEIGHWLNLLHIYGKDGDCEEGDLIDDTPTQKSQYLGVPSYPQNSCETNDMYMNFMDRVNDNAMYMFTHGQKKRMRSVFNKNKARRSLYISSK